LFKLVAVHIQALAGAYSMSLSWDMTTDVQALKSQVDPRAEMGAECNVYALLNYYRIHIDLTNWDRSGFANDFNITLKKLCGEDNLTNFTCKSRGRQGSHIVFYITYEAKHCTPEDMDKLIEDAIYNYSGSSKLRIMCQHPR